MSTEEVKGRTGGVMHKNRMTKRKGQQIAGELKSLLAELRSNPAVLRLIRSGACPKCSHIGIRYVAGSNVGSCSHCGYRWVVGGEN